MSERKKFLLGLLVGSVVGVAFTVPVYLFLAG